MLSCSQTCYTLYHSNNRFNSQHIQAGMASPVHVHRRYIQQCDRSLFLQIWVAWRPIPHSLVIKWQCHFHRHNETRSFRIDCGRVTVVPDSSSPGSNWTISGILQGCDQVSLCQWSTVRFNLNLLLWIGQIWGVTYTLTHRNRTFLHLYFGDHDIANVRRKCLQYTLLCLQHSQWPNDPMVAVLYNYISLIIYNLLDTPTCICWLIYNVHGGRRVGSYYQCLHVSS